MNIKGHTSSSARANAHSGVAGGRKTYNPIVETAGAIGDEAVLVSYLHVGRDDAVVFSDDIEEVESVPSLDTESDDEEEEEWESDEEEEDDEGELELISLNSGVSWAMFPQRTPYIIAHPFLYCPPPINLSPILTQQKTPSSTRD